MELTAVFTVSTQAGVNTSGNVAVLTVEDPTLPGGSRAISYTVRALDNATTIASALATIINADAVLGSRCTATSKGSTVTITGTTPGTVNVKTSGPGVTVSRT